MYRHRYWNVQNIEELISDKNIVTKNIHAKYTHTHPPTHTHTCNTHPHTTVIWLTTHTCTLYMYKVHVCVVNQITVVCGCVLHVCVWVGGCVCVYLACMFFVTIFLSLINSSIFCTFQYLWRYIVTQIILFLS